MITKKCWQINVSNNVFRRKVPNIIDHGLTSVGTNPQLHSPASHGFTSAGTRPQFVISAIQTRAHKYGGFTPAADANPLFSISKGSITTLADPLCTSGRCLSGAAFRRQNMSSASSQLVLCSFSLPTANAMLDHTSLIRRTHN